MTTPDSGREAAVCATCGGGFFKKRPKGAVGPRQVWQPCICQPAPAAPPTGHATAETAPDVEDLCDTIRNGIYGDDRTSWDTIGKAVEAMNTLAARASQAEALLRECESAILAAIVNEDGLDAKRGRALYDRIRATLGGGQ